MKGYIMARYTERIEQTTLPVIGLRGVVAFPGVTLSFELEDELCIAAAEAAFEIDTPVLICASKDYSGAALDMTALEKVGTLSKINQSVKTP